MVFPLNLYYTVLELYLWSLGLFSHIAFINHGFRDWWELELEDINEILDDNTKSIVYKSKVPCNGFSTLSCALFTSGQPTRTIKLFVGILHDFVNCV